MKKEDNERLLRIYSESFLKHGRSPEAVHWTTIESQRKRFEGLLSISPSLNGRSVLDLGCGLGDFRNFLGERGWNGSYRGLDLNPDLIVEAQHAFPGESFAVHDITSAPWTEEKYDYGFISGVFNNAVSDPWAFLTTALLNAFASVEKGLAFNFITDQVDIRQTEMSYYAPAAVLDFCLKNLSPHVSLDTRFMRFNVFVFVSKK